MRKGFISKGNVSKAIKFMEMHEGTEFAKEVRLAIPKFYDRDAYGYFYNQEEYEIVIDAMNWIDMANGQRKKYENQDTINEMRAAFGTGVTVVNVLTGEEIKL